METPEEPTSPEELASDPGDDYEDATFAQQAAEGVPTAAMETESEEAEESESLAETYELDCSASAQRVAEAVENSQVKREATSTTLEVKLEEAAYREAAIEHEIAEERRYIADAKAYNDLQVVELNMVAETFKAMPKLLECLNKNYENVSARYDKILRDKNELDRKMQAIADEEERVNRNHKEQVAVLKEKIAEMKKKKEAAILEWSSKTENCKKKLEAVTEKHTKIKEENERDKRNVEMKKMELNHLRNEILVIDPKVRSLVKTRDTLRDKIENAKLSVKSYKNKISEDEILLKEFQSINDKLKSDCEVESKHLEELKNEKSLLHEDIQKRTDALNENRKDRQNTILISQEKLKTLTAKHEEMKENSLKITNNLTTVRDEINHQKNILINIEGEHQTKKIEYDILDAKNQAQLNIMKILENELQQQTDKLNAAILEKEQKQNILHNAQETTKAKVSQIEAFENAKRDLEAIEKENDEKITEKTTFYENARAEFQKETKSLLSKSESEINSQEQVLAEKETELETLKSKIQELKQEQASKMEKVDELYKNHVEVDKEVKELTKKAEQLTQQSADPAFQSTSRTLLKPSSFGYEHKSILKNNEPPLLGTSAKTVTFDPTFMDSESDSDMNSELMMQVLRETFTGTQPNDTSADRPGQSFRHSPPVKE